MIESPTCFEPPSQAFFPACKRADIGASKVTSRGTKESGRCCRLPRGFTLLEVLISTSIMVVILIAVASTVGLVSSTYRRTIGGLDAFESAQSAFDTIGRTARQAILQSYIGYDDPKLPTRSLLKSDLHFVIGNQADLGLGNTKADASHAIFFQAPLGTSATLPKAKGLLASTGFFIVHGDDPIRPDFLDTLVEPRVRYRLFQFIEPRENMTLYENTIKLDSNNIPGSNAGYKGYDWFNVPANDGKSIHAIAENVIALVVWPVHEGQLKEGWNSRNDSATAAHSYHRLPQALELTLVAIDESSAMRLETMASVNLLEDLFEEAASYQADLQSLEGRLIGHRLTYRIFKTYIPLDAANTHL